MKVERNINKFTVKKIENQILTPAPPPLYGHHFGWIYYLIVYIYRNAYQKQRGLELGQAPSVSKV